MPDTVLTYKGRPIIDLTKNELVDAMTWAFQEIEYQRERADRLLNAAALAEPEPEGPTDEELLEINDGAYCPGTDEANDEDDSSWQYTSDYIRWLDENGTPEEQEAYTAKGLRAVFKAGRRWGSPAPQPIPVTERLPGPEDCVVISWSEIRSPHVWAGKRRLINGPTEIWDWTFASIPCLEESGEFTHWLPASASVLPAGAIRQSNPSA